MSEETFTVESFASRMSPTGEQLDALRGFEALIAEWNVRMNLVGPSALATFWGRHAFDSAQLLHVEQSAVCWADVGAGAGFPGVVLAILLKGRSGALVHLVESMAKRAAFLRTVCVELDLPAEVHNLRAEDLAPPESLQVVTARACAPLPRLLGYTRGFFAAGARGLFLKGRGVEAELTEARRSWTLDVEVLPSLSDSSGVILKIEKAVLRGR